jgi:uncharacterized protein with von Willebrand factor type A (vWA) domain
MKNKQENNSYLSLYPKSGVVDTNVRERAMGRLLSIPVTYYSDHARALPVPSSAVVDLSSDVFFSLYKAEPGLVETTPRSRFLNNALIRLMHNAPNFESLRANTTANIPVAMHTTVAMTNALLSDEMIVEAMKLQEMLDKLMEELSKLRQQMQQAQNQDQQGGGQPQQQQQLKQEPQPGEGGDQEQEQQPQPQQSQPQPGPGKAQEKKIEQQIEQAQSKLQSKVDSLVNNQLGQGMIGSVVDEGHDGAEEMGSMMTSWGVEAGDVSYQDANKLVKIADEQKDTLAMIAEIGGRLAGVSADTMQAVRDSYVGTPSEPTFTRDLMRMFPMNRAYLSPQAPAFVRATKVAEWAQRGLLGLRPKSEGKKRGALVIAVDGSSSMNATLCSGTLRGQRISLRREDVSKVLATGVARAMREDRFERRRYTLFTFSTEDSQIRKTTSADSWKELVDWVAYDPNGGTDFNHAFAYALDEMEKFEREGTYGADLLFISDGEARLYEEGQERLRAYRERTGARVFYLQVADKKHTSEYTLDQIGLTGLVDPCVVLSSADASELEDIPTYLAEQVSMVFTQVD